jgi:hypothetical protein
MRCLGYFVAAQQSLEFSCPPDRSDYEKNSSFSIWKAISCQVDGLSTSFKKKNAHEHEE